MKILVLSEFFCNETNANAHCAQQLVKGLVGIGFETIVMCVAEEDKCILCSKYEQILIRREEIDININLPDVIWRSYKHIKNISLIKNWPLENPRTAKKFINYTTSIINSNEICGIVAIHKSFLSVYVCEIIKKKYPNTPIILYLLDPIANTIDSKLGIRRFLFNRVIKKERKVFEVFDRIIHMRSNKVIYDSEVFSEFIAKFIYADFPLIDKDDIHKKLSSNKNINGKLKFIYFGTLNSLYRDPSYMVQVLKGISKRKDIIVDLYIQGDCLDKFEKQDKTNSIFRVHGFVSQDMLIEKIKCADIIINIGNAYSSMLPSKVIEMLMYGKSIISFSKQDEDVCDYYINKYGNSLIIKEYDNVNNSIDKLLHYLDKIDDTGTSLTCDDLIEMFEENTPYYSANIIKHFVEEYHYAK